MKRYLFFLILLTTIVHSGYTQKMVEDSIKLYIKMGGEYAILPSHKLQYFSTPVRGAFRTDDSGYTNISANVAGGVSYGLFRLEVGTSLSWLEIDDYGVVSAKDVAIPIVFSVRVMQKSGFGVHVGLEFEPHKFFDYHNGNDSRVVSDWGTKGGMFVEVSKDITRRLSFFAKFGFDATLAPSTLWADNQDDATSPHSYYTPAMYHGNTFSIGIGLLWNIADIMYK